MVYIYFFLIFFSTLLVFIFLCTVLRRTFFYFGLIREEKIQQYSLFSYEEKETFYWSNHIHFSWIFFTRPNHVVSNQIIVHYSTIFSPFSQFGTFSPFCLWLLPGAREKGDKFAERMTLMRMKVTTQYSADEHLIRGILFFFILFFCGWIFSSFHFLLLSACRSFPPMLIWKRASCALILILHRLKYFFVLESGFFFTERRKANWRWCGSQQTGKS